MVSFSIYDHPFLLASFPLFYAPAAPEVPKKEKGCGTALLLFCLYVCSQNAQLPLRKMGTIFPSSHTASMHMSAEPIIKSS